MIFYDFEVFSHNWLVVFMDMQKRKETVIVDDPAALEAFHKENINEIWVGFNSRHYDQYIFKGILCGFEPKKINDYIIIRGLQGWKYSTLFRDVPLNNYDVMTNIDRGLKTFEGFMGNNIKESSVPFDVNRPLTEKEIEETIEYCRYDVQQTVEIFLQRTDDFEAHRGLVKLACEGRFLDLSLISRTKPQLSAIILNATQRKHDDEFNIDFPPTMRIEKYTAVLDWYSDPANMCYEKDGKKNQLETMIAGVPHVFGFGGIHGALLKYNGEGSFVNMDVASLYPSLMIEYDLLSRNVKDPAKFKEIYDRRLQFKADKNPLQLPLKLVLNSTYGVMKDKNNPLYDPLQSNKVCIYGQLLLLDLIERLEPHCQIIQSNTDGVLIRMYRDEDFELIDDICYEWEQRTRLTLEFEEFRRVYQKDVNNYIIVDRDGKFKSKGAYVKKLSALDYDLPIINRALVNYMVRDIPLETTIFECDDLKEFQLVTKISNKFICIMHGDRRIKEQCIRIFASKEERDAGVYKIHAKKGNANKISNSPAHCFIWNEDVNGVKIPAKLDHAWYLEMAKKRLKDFGVD